jgi:cation diffusion facilitator family transporter
MISPPSTPSSKEQSLRVAALFCLIDLFLTGGAVFFSNSLTILSDFFKEGADFISVVAALITVRVVSRNPNERFAYGIGKLENLVSIGIGLLMLLSALYILFQAIGHLKNPEQAHGTLPGIIIFACSSVFGFKMWLHNKDLLKIQSSAIVAAQSRLWFSKAWLDLIMASALILAIAFGRYHWSFYLDPLASLVGVFFLLHGAWEVSTSSIHDLLDASLEEASQLIIMRKLVDHFDDYESVHKIRTRRSGSNIYIEVFLGFNSELKMGEIQRRVDRLSLTIQDAFMGAEVAIIASSES